VLRRAFQHERSNRTTQSSGAAAVSAMVTVMVESSLLLGMLSGEVGLPHRVSPPCRARNEQQHDNRAKHDEQEGHG
jgi:hypothetical protein